MFEHDHESLFGQLEAVRALIQASVTLPPIVSSGTGAFEQGKHLLIGKSQVGSKRSALGRSLRDTVQQSTPAFSIFVMAATSMVQKIK